MAIDGGDTILYTLKCFTRALKMLCFPEPGCFQKMIYQDINGSDIICGIGLIYGHFSSKKDYSSPYHTSYSYYFQVPDTFKKTRNKEIIRIILSADKYSRVIISKICGRKCNTFCQITRLIVKRINYSITRNLFRFFSSFWGPGSYCYT